MDRTRWQRLEPILSAALEEPLTQRQAFLDRACGGDEHLRAEAGRLLARAQESASGVASDSIDAFLERGALSAIGGAEDDLGRTVGGYRLLETIAEGGMGVVYLAERDDQQYRRQVAIKLVRRGIATGETLRRFRAERQILAALEHPNIARLYDGGKTDDGIPYLVMERIVGRPIDRYCEEQGLGVKERLRLFVPVCSAVQLAHDHFLVHRDLKPENILIDEQGVPKLLDFGIAKVLASEPTGSDPALTHTGQSPMTPAYASPEQIRGEPVSTASDVYALGVLLFRLLTGRLPYGELPHQPHEVSRAIAEREAPRPSAVVGIGQGPEASRRAGRLKRQLRGDLDNIVLKALSKEPVRRYRAVSELAADIERHLTDRPVVARRASLVYRGRKLVARYRLPIFASAAVGTLAFAVTWMATYWQLAGPGVCAGAATRLAGVWDQERRDAVKATLGSAGTPAALDVADRFVEALDRYAATWAEMYTEACVATRIRGQQSERLFDLQLLCLDDRRAEMDASVELVTTPGAEGVLTHALDIAYGLGEIGRCGNTQTLLGLQLPELDPEGERQVSNLRDQLEDLRARHRAWQPVEAGELRSMITTIRKLGHRQLEANALRFLAQVISVEGTEGVAEITHQALRASIAAGDRRLTPILYADLAEHEGYSLRELDEAADHIALAEASVVPLGDEGDESELGVRISQGIVALAAEDDAGAVRSFRLAVILGERIWGRDDPRLASPLNNLGAALQVVPGHRVEAMDVLVRAIDLKTAAYGATHPSLASSLINTSSLLAIDGRYPRALEYTSRCRRILEQDGQRDLLAYPMVASSQILNALDRADEASPLLQEAIPLIRDGIGVGTPLYLEALLALTDSHLLQLRREAAEKVLAEALELLEIDTSARSDRTAVELRRGRVRLTAGDPRDALEHLQHARSLSPDGLSSRYEELMLVLSLAQARLGVGQPAEALVLLEEVIASDHSRRHPAFLAEARLLVASSLSAEEKERAVFLARQAHAELVPGSAHSRQLQSRIVALLRSAGADPESPS